MNRITVIIPTYNRADLLGKALESVLSQSLSAAEIIVVDDGSTDDTAQVLERIADSSRVPVIYLKENNRGPAAARNSGIIKARHQFIAFLDSDDLWHKKKLEIQSGALHESPDHLISHTREKWYRGGQHLNQKKRHMPRHGYIFEHCLLLCCVGMSTVMVRKTVFERYGLFNEALRCCEDYEMWLRVARNQDFLLVDEVLTTKHGGRDDQVSQQFKVGMDRFRIQALARMFSNTELTSQQRRAVGQVLLEKCLIYGRGCRKHGNEVEGDHYLELASYTNEQIVKEDY